MILLSPDSMGRYFNIELVGYNIAIREHGKITILLHPWSLGKYRGGDSDGDNK